VILSFPTSIGLASGADYLVIGRAITEADNPGLVVDEIVKSIS
jgi:orotidine-5'-phosphate decarboxylase